MAITGINGIFMNGSAGTFIDYDIITGKVLAILKSGTLGVAATALVENPGQVAAGTVSYRLVEMVKTGSYATALDDGTGGVAQQGETVHTILVNLDINKAAKYKLEEFDLAALTSASAIQGQIASGLAISTLARLDAELFENIKNFLIANPTALTTIADFSTTTDLETMRLNRLKLNDLIADIESTINATMIGTEEFQTTSIVNKKGYARLLEGIANNGGDKGTDLRIAGQLPGNITGGNALLKHIFIGKNVPGDKITLDKILATDYDFSAIEALIWNKESIAFPIHFLGISSMRDTRDANPIFIQKFRYGFKVLRKELIRGIVNKPLTREALALFEEEQAAKAEEYKAFSALSKEHIKTKAQVKELQDKLNVFINDKINQAKAAKAAEATTEQVLILPAADAEDTKGDKKNNNKK